MGRDARDFTFRHHPEQLAVTGGTELLLERKQSNSSARLKGSSSSLSGTMDLLSVFHPTYDSSDCLLSIYQL